MRCGALTEERKMKKSQEFELRKKCNDLNAYCGVKDYLYNDGPSRGLRAFDLKNGKNIQMTLLADRGMDISNFTYKGINIGLNNKVGIRSPYLYVEDAGSGFLKQFYGGMLTTCGITYSGAPGEDNGKMLGLHGPFDNLPAEQACAKVDYEGDERVIRATADVREVEVFGTDMVMKREFTLHSESDKLCIKDTVINQSFETQPVELIYHINFGYPMLDAGAKCYFNGAKIEPRTDFAAEGLSNYDEMEEPGVGRDEQCYFFTGYPENGEGFAMLHNEKLGCAAIVSFDAKVLPLLCEWKCMRAGEYALGLEPTTSGPLNRAEARKLGTLTYLEAGESREYNVSIEMTDDPAVIEHYKSIARKA